MLEIIWPIFIIISILFSFINGNLDVLNENLFKTIENTTQTAILMLGRMCFWNGMIYILKNTKFFDSLIVIIFPVF